MKKTYLPPETISLSMVTEPTFICASGEGEDLMRNATYFNNYSEDEFWD